MNTRAKGKQQSQQFELIAVLHALADPVRLEIVRQLSAEGEKACGLFGIKMPKSSLSHHFSILRQAGLIASENEGTTIMNRLRVDDLEKQFPGLLSSVLAATRENN
jgi:DNA-binding transcriptional ArsR family regulator